MTLPAPLSSQEVSDTQASPGPQRPLQKALPDLPSPPRRHQGGFQLWSCPAPEPLLADEPGDQDPVQSPGIRAPGLLGTWSRLQGLAQGSEPGDSILLCDSEKMITLSGLAVWLPPVRAGPVWKEQPLEPAGEEAPQATCLPGLRDAATSWPRDVMVAPDSSPFWDRDSQKGWKSHLPFGVFW